MNSIKSHNEYSDRTLRKIDNGDGGVFYKIDWLTIVVRDQSFVDVLRYFGISLNEDFFAAIRDSYFADPNYGRKLRVNIYGILFELEARDIEWQLDQKYGHRCNDPKEYDPMFIAHCFLSWIRIDLCGSGLDWLRSQNVDIEAKVRNISNIGWNFTFTRCDFAYDFVNYSGYFVEALHQLCNQNHKENNKLACHGSQAGVSWRVKYGDKEHIIYFGASGAQQMIRFYDKKLERIAKNDLTGCPYTSDGSLPQSWIRIELQTRHRKERSLPYDLIFAENYSAESVLRYIFDFYAVHECGSIYDKISPVWLDLFEWETLSPIIQNAKTVQSIDVKTASYKYFDFNLKNHLFVLCSLGRDKMVNRIVCDWYNLQRSESSLDRRRFSCILLSLTSAFEGLPPYLYFSKEKSLYLIKGFEDLV